MATPHAKDTRSRQERSFGRGFLSTVRQTVNVDAIVPNEKHLRTPPFEDAELQRQVEADGLLLPLLLEQDTSCPGKFRIIDGHRRWASCRALASGRHKSEFGFVPADIITDKILTDDERLQLWVRVQRQ